MTPEIFACDRQRQEHGEAHHFHPLCDPQNGLGRGKAVLILLACLYAYCDDCISFFLLSLLSIYYKGSFIKLICLTSLGRDNRV